MIAHKNFMSGVKSFVYAILIGSFSILSFAPPSIPEPDRHVFYKLNFTVKAPVVRPDLEAQMLMMINKERATEGLRPLVPDPELTVVARKHSIDMFTRGYFSHYTPEQVGPFDRMKEFNLRYIKAGENLSMAPTLGSSHRGLMKSPGHRENIMKGAFGRVGIGIMDGGRYGLMVTQDFRN
jgi:uncharacterized protein YkwD